ncbi:hypothetical protein AYL99_11916 [Fonsecaea erecta]|uniref:Uncharacterized protein n=1 Tax=Fonsecaea erecta TaxID=1367422 RepID=A0A178Z2H1_9EURO|nr:hypothetical protein AYL99_11916 [Fonsecaea erecta]OAP53894.1 hypothetical protein AYL99_11916 [Fonsecaea erecta]
MDEVREGNDEHPVSEGSTFLQEEGRYLHRYILPTTWQEFGTSSGATTVVVLAHSLGSPSAIVATALHAKEPRRLRGQASLAFLELVGDAHKKSQTGCYTCKIRHVKCGEEKANCVWFSKTSRPTGLRASRTSPVPLIAPLGSTGQYEYSFIYRDSPSSLPASTRAPLR